MKKLITILVFLLLLCGWQMPLSANESRQNYIIKITTRSDLDFFRQQKIDVDRESSKFNKNEISVYLSSSELATLQQNGYTAELVVDKRSKAEATKGYYTYATLTTALQNMATANPSICQLFSIGKSVNGKEMWALKISDNVATDEVEPEFLYSSTMHGDEVTGMELMMKLANEMLTKYQTANDTVKYLIDNTQIYIIPDYNPDGTAKGNTASGRYNANGVDLNRDFPERFTNEPNTITGRAIETQNMMNWIKNRHFVLGGNFHGGAEVVNYPWDYFSTDGVYTASPDDANYIWLSRSYVDRTPYMNVTNSDYNPGNGITNGAAWYVVAGGMQDWLYNYYSQLHITIELSNTKWPSFSQIASYWSKNRSALYWYMMAVHKGVNGTVTSQSTGEPLAATVRVNGINKDYFSVPSGDYYRVLKPGTYSLTFSAAGYQTKTINNVVVTDPAGLIATATKLNVQLEPNIDAPAFGVLTGNSAEPKNAMKLKLTVITDTQIPEYVKAIYTIGTATETITMTAPTKQDRQYTCTIPAQNTAITGSIIFKSKYANKPEATSSSYELKWADIPIIPFAENFDGSWTIATSLTTNSANWSGSGSAVTEWHKNDFKTGWTSSSGGSPSSSGANTSTNYARFHSFGITSATKSSMITPTINLANNINKSLEFYYINPTGTDAMDVYISTDNGTSFGSSLLRSDNATSWTKKSINLTNINSSQVKIKFEAVSDYGNDDIGLDQLSIKLDSSSIADTELSDKNILLAQNYPNPFNPETMISFRLAAPAQTELAVYNIKGELVSTLLNGVQPAGISTVKFDARQLNSGVYFYRLTSENTSLTGKMLYVK